MKKISILFLSFLLGCGLANSDFFTKNYEFDQPLEANVGESLITIEQGKKNDVYGWVLSGSRQELVYAGKDHNVLQIDYREYMLNRNGAFIKDGFTQHLRYDLSESNVIVYKDIKLKILESNGSKVKYIVIK